MGITDSITTLMYCTAFYAHSVFLVELANCLTNQQHIICNALKRLAIIYA